MKKVSVVNCKLLDSYLDNKIRHLRYKEAYASSNAYWRVEQQVEKQVVMMRFIIQSGLR